MRNLDSSEWFANPNLDIINVQQKGGDRVSTFKLQVNQQAKTPQQNQEAETQPDNKKRKPKRKGS
jgi:Tfp pilus assembly protein PilN